MAQQLQSINLVAPAFKGINTEDSPLAQDPSFAEIADNAVIDKRGRLAARKGYDVITTPSTSEYLVVDNTDGFVVGETVTGGTSNATAVITLLHSSTEILIDATRSGTFTASETITGSDSSNTATFSSVATSASLGSSAIRLIHEFEDDQGNTEIISAGNSKIFTGTRKLVDATPGSYTITADNWKAVNFNNKTYLFQRAHEPLVYDGSSVVKLSSVTGAAGIATRYGNEVLSAFGRLWVADISADKSTVYWSDLLIGHDFEGGTSGSINLAKVWPDGYDEIVGLAAHNSLLIIFGRHSIVVYQGAEAPATMALADTVSGVGCVDRDTIQYTGTDVIFLSHTGLRSFGRTIREKSMPVSSLSKTITKDIIGLIQGENNFFRSVYSPEESFYLLTFVGQTTTFCFDVRGSLEDGSFRVTRWPGSEFTAYTRLQNGSLYIGSEDGISKYDGYSDNGTSYRFKYFSPSLTFGDTSRLKILKKVKPTLVGANSATVFMKFAYDFATSYRTTEFTVGNQNPAFFNVNEFGADSSPLSEFTGGELTNQRSLNAVGSGSTVVVGLESDINGFALSLQEINLLALMGKTV